MPLSLALVAVLEATKSLKAPPAQEMNATLNVHLSLLNGLEEKRAYARTYWNHLCSMQKPSACLKIGQIHEQASQLNEASEFFEKSCTLGDPYGCLSWGKLFFRKNEMARAETILRQACTSHTVGCSELAEAEFALGKTKEATSRFQDLCEKNNFQACLWMGLTELGANHSSSALTFFEKSCLLGDTFGCINSAQALFLTGQQAEGLKRLKDLCFTGEKKACEQLSIMKQDSSLQRDRWKKSCLSGPSSTSARNACAALSFTLSLDPSKRTDALDLAEKACQLGDGDSCLLSADFSNNINAKDATSRLVEACKKGAGLACLRLDEGAPLPEGTLQPRGTYSKIGCDRDNADACAYLGFLNLESGNFPEGLELLKKACSIGNPRACYFHVAYGEPDPVKKQNELVRLCQRNDPRACRDLASITLANNQVAEAKNLYTKACNLRESAACIERLGLDTQTLSNLGSWFETDSHEQPEIHGLLLKELKRFCNLENLLGCQLLARLNVKVNHAEEAAQAMIRGCSLKDSSMCFEAGIMTKTEPQVALSFLLKGCTLGHDGACLELDRMTEKKRRLLYGVLEFFAAILILELLRSADSRFGLRAYLPRPEQFIRFLKKPKDLPDHDPSINSLIPEDLLFSHSLAAEYRVHPTLSATRIASIEKTLNQEGFSAKIFTGLTSSENGDVTFLVLVPHGELLKVQAFLNKS